MIRILFLICSCITLQASDLHWEPTELVWNMGFAQECNKGLCPDPKKHFESRRFDKKAYQNIQNGDIVWVKSQFVKNFHEKVLPKVKNPFVLIICDGDESFPSNSKLEHHLDAFINNKYIKHIFAQNCDYKGPSQKVSHLPIGLDLHTFAYKSGDHLSGLHSSPIEQERELKSLLETLKPTHLRKKKAFVDFHHNNTMDGPFQRNLQFGEDRLSIFERLKPTGLIEFGPMMARNDLWKIKGEYAFSISPPGNGLDCHRTWEDLILGCIVIVKTSPLDPLYEGLPVVIVKDWAEVTEENMTKWLDQYKDAFTDPSYRNKLTRSYWVNKIRSAAEVEKKKWWLF